jgi:hypothetical protein
MVDSNHLPQKMEHSLYHYFVMHVAVILLFYMINWQDRPGKMKQVHDQQDRNEGLYDDRHFDDSLTLDKQTIPNKERTRASQCA